MASMEFFRNQSGIRLDIDELRQLIEQDMVEQVAELIILLDELEVFDDEEGTEEGHERSEEHEGIDFPFDIGTFLGVNNPDDDQDRPPKKR